jgi:uncharacterized membrane protein YhiD involved in acid resistance
MNRLQTFAQFLTTTSGPIPVGAFVLNLLLAGLLAYVLSQIYARYGNSLSNRKLFSQNFVLMTMTTMMIISIVKSSLALSLGLVGALSIVRFRAAIKEPEELAYLFLAICLGLGFGANQGIITAITFFIVVAIIVMKNRVLRKDENQNLFLTVHNHNPRDVGIEHIVETLQNNSSGVNLKRFDETDKVFEASFLVEFRDFKQLNEAKYALQKLDGSLKISFLDNKGVV